MITIHEYLMKKCNVKRFLRIFQRFFVTLLSFRKSFSENVKYTTFFNRPCLQYFIDLNSDELRYYSFMVSLGRCNGSFDTFHYLSGRSCNVNKTKVNIKVISMIPRKSESKKQ